MADISRLPGAYDHYWDWQLEAACRRVENSLFFHPAGERGAAHKAREEAAKAVCAMCPVRVECRRHALETREPYGVWGGLSEEERNLMLSPAHHRSAA
ncbi:WhiB family transcriptional regulator [Kitasatospora sp. NPDC017646]|uniref:WhiB family transcriptional regulator n=1 Tax=Kitasatospora sp. NPDC017646 TaxID=3364024 RepID=UPI0037B4307E